MNRKKLLLIIGLAFLTVGFAAVTTVLYVNGTVSVKNNQNGFVEGVIFDSSSITTNNIESYTMSDSGRTLSFNVNNMKNVGDEASISFKIKNYSQYNARLDSTAISCYTVGTYEADIKSTAITASEYITITPSSNLNNTLISAGGGLSNEGTITIKQIRSYAGTGDLTINFQCMINVAAEESNVQAVEVQYVAIRDGVRYTSLQAAIDSIPDNEEYPEIYLIGPVTENELTIGNHNVYIDTNLDTSDLGEIFNGTVTLNHPNAQLTFWEPAFSPSEVISDVDNLGVLDASEYDMGIYYLVRHAENYPRLLIVPVDSITANINAIGERYPIPYFDALPTLYGATFDNNTNVLNVGNGYHIDVVDYAGTQYELYNLDAEISANIDIPKDSLYWYFDFGTTSEGEKLYVISSNKYAMPREMPIRVLYDNRYERMRVNGKYLHYYNGSLEDMNFGLFTTDSSLIGEEIRVTIKMYYTDSGQETGGATIIATYRITLTN